MTVSEWVFISYMTKHFKDLLLNILTLFRSQKSDIDRLIF